MDGDGIVYLSPNIQSAFSKFIHHSKSYTNDSYACCGETSRDTVCKKSKMSLKLRNLYSRKASLLSKEESKMANEAKQRALNILNDALKKKGSLLVDDPDEFGEKKKSVLFPLISTDLVKELISTLQEVTFKRDKHPERETETIAYVYPTAGDRTVYLCLLFFKQCEFLRKHSRPETLIHEVSHLLGYGHTIEENKEKLKTSQQYKLCPVSVPYIEKAFSLFMNHKGTYINGSYSCCGETSRDTLCEKSAMAYELRKVRDELSGHEEPLEHLEEMRNLRENIDHMTLRCLEMKLRLEEISVNAKLICIALSPYVNTNEKVPGTMGKVSRSSSLSLEESQLANEAKKRTLAILNDALKKKDALLLDNPEEFGDQEKPSHFPLISTDLVKQMIPQLEKATFGGSMKSSSLTLARRPS
ncbi:uncharacterized protein ACMZJ9_010175 [Mantella aurantiaca]